MPFRKLGVELDGEGHMSVADVHYDNERRRFVEHFGVYVLRIENEIVFKDPGWVVERIRSCFGWREQ